MIFASLMARFVAFGIDVWGFLMVLLAAALLEVALPESAQVALSAVLATAWLIVLPASKLQATPAKLLVGIRVADMNGNRIGYARSVLRFVLTLATVATGGIGFLLAAWTPRRQALHDFGARTVVVHRQATPAQIAAAHPPPMGWGSRLAGCVALAVLWIILSVCVDTYRATVVRDRMRDVLEEAGAYRMEVVAAMEGGRAMPAPPAKLNRYTRKLSAMPDGTIVVETDDALFKAGAIILTPKRVAGGIEWSCSTRNISQKYLPATCRVDSSESPGESPRK